MVSLQNTESQSQNQKRAGTLLIQGIPWNGIDGCQFGAKKRV